MPTRKYLADLTHSIISAVDRKHQDKLQDALDDAQKYLKDPEEFLNTTIKNKKKYTFLDYATRSGWLEGISLLLGSGANPNIATNNGQGSYPITTAIDYQHKKISLLQTLLENGADPNVKDKTDCSPLYLASCQGSLKIVLLLIENGADLRIRNKGREKVTALRGAVTAKHYRTACTLVEHLYKQKLAFSLETKQLGKLKAYASSDIQGILELMSPSKSTPGRYTFSPDKIRDTVTIEKDSEIASDTKRRASQVKVFSSNKDELRVKTTSKVGTQSTSSKAAFTRKKIDRVQSFSSDQLSASESHAQDSDFVYQVSNDFKRSKKEGKKPQKNTLGKESKVMTEQSEDSLSDAFLVPAPRRTRRGKDGNTQPFTLNKIAEPTEKNNQSTDPKRLAHTTTNQNVVVSPLATTLSPVGHSIPRGAHVPTESFSTNRRRRMQFKEESANSTKPLQPVIDQYESLSSEKNPTSSLVGQIAGESHENEKSLAINRFRHDSLIDAKPVRLKKPSPIITDLEEMYSSEETMPSPLFSKHQSTLNILKQSSVTHKQEKSSTDKVDSPREQTDLSSDEDMTMEEINKQIAALETQNISNHEQSFTINNKAMSSADDVSLQEEQTDMSSAEDTPIEEIIKQIASLETENTQVSDSQFSNQSSTDFANAFREELASPNELFLSRLEQSASSGNDANQSSCDLVKEPTTNLSDPTRQLREGFLKALQIKQKQANDPEATESIALKK